MADPSQLRFTIVELDHGWVSATLQADSHALHIEASYIGVDALEDLVRNVTAVTKSPDLERDCKWLAEPGEYRWVFSPAPDGVRVRVVWFTNWPSRLEHDRGELLFETVTSIQRLATQVRGQMIRWRNDIGAEEYRRRWHHEFPSAAVSQLSAFTEAAKSRP